MRSFHRRALLLFLSVQAACAGQATSGGTDEAPPLGRLEAEAKRVEEPDSTPDGVPGPSPAPEAMASFGHFSGTVEGQTFAPTHHFFTRGIMQAPGEPDVVIFVQTDAPDLCEHLARGTMPRHATMFAVALRHGEDGPQEVGGVYKAPNDVGQNTSLLALAYFRRLDGQCEITPEPTGAEATFGSATLQDLVDGQSASLSYALTLSTGDKVEGSLTASYCAAPALFDRPEALMVEVDPADCR